MPEYRMQTLLEIRQRAEEAAKRTFSEALQAAAKEQQRLSDMQTDLENRKKDRVGRVKAFFEGIGRKGTAAKGLADLHAFENRLKDKEAQLGLEIEAQKTVVAASLKRAEIQRIKMVEASRELKAIEKHKEKWVQKVKAEREMREDLRVEEVGNSLHLSRARQRSDVS